MSRTRKKRQKNFHKTMKEYREEPKIVKTPTNVVKPKTDWDKRMRNALIVVLVVIVSIMVFSFATRNIDQLPSAGVVSIPEESSLTYLMTENCGDKCDTFKPIAEDYAQKLGIKFRVINYDMNAPMPGIYLMLGNKMTPLAGIDNEEALEAYLCDMTGNELVCGEKIIGTDITTNTAEMPFVDLFVMSHDGFGLQAERAIIPVVELLGDKIHFNVRFLYYAMHGEVELQEQVNQYCIQKNEYEKFIPYLKCFIENGEGNACMGKVGIDPGVLNKCMAEANDKFKIIRNANNRSLYIDDKFPRFTVDQGLNKLYGVEGSPTLVLNGEQVQQVSRDPQSMLDAICLGFTERPLECDQVLNSTVPTPGFG